MDGVIRGRLAQVVRAASRRHALRTALGGAALATAGIVASDLGGDAKKKKKCKKKCKKCQALAVGAACETNRQCCPNETNRICYFPEGVLGPVCCGAVGATCASPTECCGGFICFEGECVFAG